MGTIRVTGFEQGGLTRTLNQNVSKFRPHLLVTTKYYKLFQVYNHKQLKLLQSSEFADKTLTTTPHQTTTRRKKKNHKMLHTTTTLPLDPTGLY